MLLMLMVMMMTRRLATTVERDACCLASSRPLTCATFHSTSLSLSRSRSLARHQLERQPSRSDVVSSFTLCDSMFYNVINIMARLAQAALLPPPMRLFLYLMLFLYYQEYFESCGRMFIKLLAMR